MDGSGHQVLNAPLAAYGTPSNGKLYFKHLTGVLAVQVTGFDGFCLDSITVISGGGGDPCVPLHGVFHVDFSNIASYDATGIVTVMEGSGFERVAMVFDQTELNWTDASTQTVHLPVPPSPMDTKYTIRIAGHVNGKKYVYERKQPSSSRVVRAVLGYVPVEITSIPNAYTTTGALFATEEVGGINYYKISSTIDFKLMCKAISNTWSYAGSYYNHANYRLQGNIDMSNVEVCSMDGLNGNTIDGNNHTVSNLDVNYFNFWANGAGLLNNPNNATLKNLTISGLNIIGGSASTHCYGAICGTNNSGGLTIDNVNVTGFRIQFSESPRGYIGGFVGYTENDVTVSNSSVTFADYVVSRSNSYIVGGIASHINNCTLDAENVSVDFNNVTFTKTDAGGATDYYFGGVLGTLNGTGVFSPDNVTLSGTMTLRCPSAITYTPVIGNGASSDAEVDVSGLTINFYLNGVLQ